MPARILILDGVATNRIVLKAKMLAAQFTVDTCATQKEAEEAIATHRPDLILLNLIHSSNDLHKFCRSLRSSPDTAPTSVIVIGAADTARARFAALDAGADDVIAHPINDTLLLARMRSLLRVRSAGQELSLRESTARALGFEEPRSAFASPAKIAYISGSPCKAVTAQSPPIATISMQDALAPPTPAKVPDVVVIDARAVSTQERTLLSLVSELRSRADTRFTSQLVITPPDEPEIAALFLDLGADDVVHHNISAAEMKLRIRALTQRKQQQDTLRATVRDGLHAALTDPLTGLYNRRYFEPHLAKVAEQSRASGRSFAVLIIDIDYFKSVNDRFGHAAGDKVLVELSARLRENLRAIDTLARVGGEEFMVAMPRTSARQAKLTADRLRRMVTNAAFAIGEDYPPATITVSIGVAVSETEKLQGCCINDLCHIADQALFAAKSAGRNQIAMGQSAA